jgi:putative membrane protein
MEFRARDRVLELTAVLSAVALAAVFGTVLGAVPASAIPRVPADVLNAIPHVNAAISTVAIATILLGVRFVRRGDVRRHRAMMLASFGLFAAFLVLYLYRIALRGPAEFPGPETVYTLVYLPTLAVHILLAIVCIPLLFYALLLALTRPVAAIYETSHRRVGRIAAALWLISFFLGNVVYVLLYVVY